MSPDWRASRLARPTARPGGERRCRIWAASCHGPHGHATAPAGRQCAQALAEPAMCRACTTRAISTVSPADVAAPEYSSIGGATPIPQHSAGVDDRLAWPREVAGHAPGAPVDEVHLMAQQPLLRPCRGIHHHAVSHAPRLSGGSRGRPARSRHSWVRCRGRPTGRHRGIDAVASATGPATLTRLWRPVMRTPRDDHGSPHLSPRHTPEPGTSKHTGPRARPPGKNTRICPHTP